MHAPPPSPPRAGRRALLLGSSAWVALVARPAWAVEPAPALILARDWTPGRSPAGFLVSEKLDGVRALWDGRALRLRGGGTAAAPAWFTQRLPRDALDGELWMGPGRFDAVSACVRRLQPLDAEWQAVQYRVFEQPGGAGPFQARARDLAALCARVGWTALHAQAQQAVPDAAALDAWLQRVTAAGGEGLMLHRADAPYHTGRSDALLKYKPQPDADAVVEGHQGGRGKYAGLMGGLQVRTADGRRFVIGTGFTDAQRADPPPVGAVVTYRYRGFTPGGLPRFASFVRVREAGF